MFGFGIRAPREIRLKTVAHLNVLSLEDRSVPATFTVNIVGDAGTADSNPLKGDLRYCVGKANSTAGNDTIVFDAAITSVNLTSQLAVTDTAGLLVDGGGTVAIINTANGAIARLFDITTTSSPEIEFRGLTLKNGNLLIGGGGAIQAANTTLKLTNCTFADNQTLNGAGGAISLLTPATTLTISGCTFLNNTAKTSGGAIQISGSTTMTINGSAFEGNVNSTTTGGAINVAAASTVNIGVTSGCTFINNKSTTHGGAIHFQGTVGGTINNSTFSGNSNALVSGSGGALSFNTSVTLSASNSNFVNNTAGSAGGAIRCGASTATITLNSSSVTGNVSSTTGGGVSMFGGKFYANYSTIGNNTSGVTGGGLYCTAATITMTNCTISGNEAKGAGGGGINLTSGSLILNNSTVAYNRATNASGVGGGIRKSQAGTMTFQSTVVALNTAATGPDMAATTTPLTVGGDNNFTGVGTSNSVSFTNPPVTGDPKMLPLDNNGGPTLTNGFRYDSPLVDHGNTTGLAGKTNDQRGAGFSRTVDDPLIINGTGGPTDIGAIEGGLTIPWADAITGAGDVTAKLSSPYTFQITYDDETGINVSFLNNGEVKVSGPAGSFVPVVTGTVPGPGANETTVTYSFNPPGGQWDLIHNGLYTVELLANKVQDNDSPTPQLNRAQSLTTFRVDISSTATPPTVNGILVNNGDSQRSLVTSIKVSFSEAVSFPSGINSAFVVERTDQGTLGPVNIVAMHSGSDVTITFATGGTVDVDPGNSLQDGKYKLTIVADNVMGAGGKLDGDGDMMAEGSPTDDKTATFHRLFGDGNGDGSVNATDFAMFRSVFGLSGPSIFDFNNDNTTNASDFAQFRGRFGLGGFAP